MGNSQKRPKISIVLERPRKKFENFWAKIRYIFRH